MVGELVWHCIYCRIDDDGGSDNDDDDNRQLSRTKLLNVEKLSREEDFYFIKQHTVQIHSTAEAAVTAIVTMTTTLSHITCISIFLRR